MRAPRELTFLTDSLAKIAIIFDAGPDDDIARDLRIGQLQSRALQKLAWQRTGWLCG